MPNPLKKAASQRITTRLTGSDSKETSMHSEDDAGFSGRIDCIYDIENASIERIYSANSKLTDDDDRIRAEKLALLAKFETAAERLGVSLEEFASIAAGSDPMRNIRLRSGLDQKDQVRLVILISNPLYDRIYEQFGSASSVSKAIVEELDAAYACRDYEKVALPATDSLGRLYVSKRGTQSRRLYPHVPRQLSSEISRVAGLRGVQPSTLIRSVLSARFPPTARCDVEMPQTELLTKN